MADSPPPSSSSRSAMEMDSETALQLVKNGGTLLLLDVPQFTLLGIDSQMFSVGPKFKGIKMIPPGSHFVYYCSSNKEGNEFSPTVGFFLTICPSEVVVRRWHQQEERLIEVSEEEESRYSEAVKRLEFDNYLGPYQLERYGDWYQLSEYLSRDLIERLEPIGGEITIMYESKLMDESPKTEMERRLMDQLKGLNCSSYSKKNNNSLRERENKGCYYTSIPHFIRNKSISRDELTALNLDKTKLLETILNKDYMGQEDMLLGELQFSFITFLMGQSLEGFLQWKSLVTLLLSCDEAPLHTRTRLFSKFMKVIYNQLKHGFQSNPKQKSSSLLLDEAWFSKEIFLYRLCKDFFPLVLEAQAVDGDLLLWTRKLKKLLETTLGWDFESNLMDLLADGDDEFAPVIVPLDEAT